PMVVAAADREVGLAPDDVRADFEAGGLDASLNSARMLAGVPAVHDITGEQLPGLQPINSVVVGNLADPACCIGQVPSFGRFLAPGRAIINTVGRIRDHQERLLSAQQSLDTHRVGRINHAYPVAAWLRAHLGRPVAERLAAFLTLAFRHWLASVL